MFKFSSAVHNYLPQEAATRILCTSAQNFQEIRRTSTYDQTCSCINKLRQRAIVLKEIYLDYNGSTPIDPRVAEVMVPILVKGVGNASSMHRVGQIQAAVIDEAREYVAVLVGGRPSNVVFTAGATESNNLALIGILNYRPKYKTKILVSSVEHASVRETARWIGVQKLAEIEIVPVTNGGFVDLDALEALVDINTLLVSVMAANSETGVLNPIEKIAELAHASNALFHCDATQFVGRLPFDLEKTGADFVSVSGHKICGPTGVGALVGTRQSMRVLQPIIHGGGHEQGLRSGSLNTSGIVGLGAAAQIAADVRVLESENIAKLRDYLTSELKSRISGVYENGDVAKRLPNTANVRFEFANAEAVLVNMDPVAISTGSACSSGSVEPSRVLLAMGISREAAFESVRFSLGRFTTREEIDLAIQHTISAVDYVRSMTREAL